VSETLDILTQFRSISLDEMDAVKLMNRVDTKYVMTELQLQDFLSLCVSDYRVLSIDGSKISDYRSLYFDTVDRQMYLRYLYGRKTRQKVRTRTYISSGQTFLEIKRKNNHGRTKKKRMEIPQCEYADFSHDTNAVNYLEAKSWYKVSDLQPTLNTTFSRITLVNDSMTERLTIDRNLSFNESLSLDGIVIIEIKQDGLTSSVAKQRLHSLKVQDYRISKYCIGTALTNPNLPHNRFNIKIRYIEKLQRQWKNRLTSIPQ